MRELRVSALELLLSFHFEIFPRGELRIAISILNVRFQLFLQQVKVLDEAPLMDLLLHRLDHLCYFENLRSFGFLSKWVRHKLHTLVQR